MTRRLPNAHTLVRAEDKPATATAGQCSTTSSTAHTASNGRPLPSWPSCAPCFAPRPILAALRGPALARRIAAGRLRGGARRAPDPTLELRDPLVLHSDALLKALNLLVHPQQHSDDRFAALVIDRFGLDALHNYKIPCKSRKPCPRTDELNAYSFFLLDRTDPPTPSVDQG